jgi:hypothetical protein
MSASRSLCGAEVISVSSKVESSVLCNWMTCGIHDQDLFPGGNFAPLAENTPTRFLNQARPARKEHGCSHLYFLRAWSRPMMTARLGEWGGHSWPATRLSASESCARPRPPGGGPPPELSGQTGHRATVIRATDAAGPSDGQRAGPGLAFLDVFLKDIP